MTREMDTSVNRWTRGTFDTATARGRYPEDGWTNGPLGLHLVRGLWVVTHLRSGSIVCRIDAMLPTAKKLAAEIAALVDWDFGRWGMARCPVKRHADMLKVRDFIDGNPRLLRADT